MEKSERRSVFHSRLSELRLKWSLWEKGARGKPLRPDAIWAKSMNSALRSPDEVQLACQEVERCGLPLHGDECKNWDALIVVTFALERTKPDAKVLEVGATFYSAALRWLYLY